MSLKEPETAVRCSPAERDFFYDSRLIRVRYITGVILRAGLVPWALNSLSPVLNSLFPVVLNSLFPEVLYQF